MGVFDEEPIAEEFEEELATEGFNENDLNVVNISKGISRTCVMSPKHVQYTQFSG